MTFYQYIKFYLIFSLLSEICSEQAYIAKMKKGSKSVNTGDKVTVTAFCKTPHGPLSVYKVSLDYLQYF